MGAYDDLVPVDSGVDPYADLVPPAPRPRTTDSPGRVRLESYAAGMERLGEETPLGAIGQRVALGGKTLLAAFADMATVLPGGPEPSAENLRAYAQNPEAPLPVEEGLAEMSGLGSIPTKAAAGLIRTVPALGATALLAGAGVPSALAAAIPMSADERGVPDPKGVAVGAMLPGVSAAGERAVAAGLARLPMKEVAIVLSRDPLRLKGKVVQKFGPVDLSNDVFRQWMETGGGVASANAFLLATQIPEIAALPAEQRVEAVIDSMAANIGPSLLGFVARKPMSGAMERMAPEIMRRAKDAFTAKPPPRRGPGGPNMPAEEGAPVPPPDPAGPYGDLVPTKFGGGEPKPQEASPMPPAPTGVVEPVTPPREEVTSNEQGQTQEPKQEEGVLIPPPDSKPAPPPDGPAPEPVKVPAPLPPTPATPPDPAATNPGELVANFVRNSLANGGAVGQAEVLRMGKELGLEEREAEEWAELGSTEASRGIVQTEDMTPREKFAALVSLYDKMPRAATRDVETKVNQQYSTPPPLAYVASLLADIPGGTRVVDPTAGHGMLTIATSPKANVVLNELAQGRLERLTRFVRGSNAFVSNMDATSAEFFERLALSRVDRLAMNPPFGTVMGPDGKSISWPIANPALPRNQSTVSIDLAIGLNALDKMAPDGKAFLIIGSKTGTPFGEMSEDPAQRAKDYQRGVMLEFFQRFNVVDWFTVGGDLYRKMGAGWPVDVIIVHGKGKTPSSKEGGIERPWIKPPRVIESWEELGKLIPEAKHESIHSPKPQPRPEAGGSSGRSPGGRSDGSTPGAGQGGGERSGGEALPAPRPERIPAAGGGGDGGGRPAVDAGRPRPPAPPAPAGVPGDSGDGIGKGKPGAPGPVDRVGAPAPEPRAPGVGERSAPPAPRRDLTPQPPTEGLPASLMVPYVGASRGPSLNLVAPRNIASQMLNAQRALEREVGMPVDEYVAGKLGRDLATLHKQLAGAQIDALALAIRNIERGAGLITADETGVGKGRVVAGIIEYARQRGLVPIFVTAKKNLYNDMVSRDLVALGNTDFKPFITDNQHYYEDGRGREVKVNRKASVGAELMADVVKTGNLPQGAQAVFTTYAQLGGDRPAGYKEDPKAKFKRKANREGRPDGPRWAMLRALAPRSIFILDEAHLAAGNDSEVNLKFGPILPTARGTYYSSATFAKRPDNLGIYALGTSMKLAGLDAEKLAEALTKGGVPMQQAVTSMLADAGELVRRQQDWTGVEMQFLATSTDATAEIEAADTYTGFIRDLMTLAKLVNRAASALEDGENQVRPEDAQVRMEPITFGSRLFNLSNQYLLALRVDAIVRQATAELKAGRKPFIALYNTMEGPIQDLQARKLPISFAGMLAREMYKMLTITVRDPAVESGKRFVELKPEDLPDGGEYFRTLERQVLGTDFSRFPISPIDSIRRGIESAGYTVAELTARDGEVDDTGEEIVLTKRDKTERTKILKAYNDGDVDALIVNGSGSTGLSAHTDPRFKDQRQRAMIVGQPAPDINEFMQMLGRVMRSGQTSRPIYRILNTALAAERRFGTMLRGKMTSLNANTTAEGESKMTQSEGFASDIFNEIGDRVVARVMRANLFHALQMDIVGLEGFDEMPDFARYATGRFVLLPNEDAQRLWDEIVAEYTLEIEQLDQAGQNPLKATAEDLRAKTIEATTFVEGTGSTPFDGPANLERASIRPPDPPPTHQEAVTEAQEKIPQARTRAREFLGKSQDAQNARVRDMRQRGATDAQVEQAEQQFAKVRQALNDAFRMLGDTWGVDALGDGASAFFGVAVDLRLSMGSVSDFASLSRQTLVLRTNTYRGKYTIPLSKLFTKDGSMLRPVDEAEAAEMFASTAERTSERYIVTGNLLRGWEAAYQASSGRDGGRPHVAIFTRDDGSLATGILMPPSWSPGEKAVLPVQSGNEFVELVQAGNRLGDTLGSAVRGIQIERSGDRGVSAVVRVPSNMAGRVLWGDPIYRGFFVGQPVQRGGKFVGELALTEGVRFYDWLASKGVKLAVKPAAPQAAELASRGAFVSTFSRGPGSKPQNVPVTFGGMNLVRPLELPELVRLVRSLTGESPGVGRAGKKALGKFQDGAITLDPRIFRDPEVAAMVLAHEIGHLVDYLPDAELRRGNLLGHLLALRRFLNHTFGPLKAVELRTELLDVTRWWRPYDPAVDPPSYVKYRETPEELYADALSVLFNAPAELEQRAPKFYEAFWSNLDRRPEVRDALFALQDLLGKGKVQVIDERARTIEQAFAEGEARWKQAVADREAAAKSWDGWWTRLWQELYWNHFPMEQRAAQVERRGVKLKPEEDPRKFLDDLGYRDTTVMAWGRRVFERVIQPVEASGMTIEDFGKFLLYQRILNGDRSGLANPSGLTPQAAQLGLLRMNLDLGIDRMTVLRDAVKRFHDDVFTLAEQAVQVGAYNRTTFNTVIKPNRDTYATFAVLDYVDDWIPAGIKEQVGTLKDVANPFQATILKSISLINLIAYQQAKNKTVKFLTEYFPDEITRGGEDKPAARRDRAPLMVLENGRPVHYQVDPYIAEAFERRNPKDLHWLTKAADGLFRRFVYPFIITYNPGFLLFMSPLRDLQRTGRNLPGAFGRLRLLPEYVRQYRQVRQRYSGESGPLIREMEANLGLGTPFDQITRANRDDFVGDLLRRMRVMPNHEIRGFLRTRLWRPVTAALDQLEAVGMTLDTLTKVSAYSLLRQQGMKPKVAGAWVRNYAGLPNTNKKGLWMRQVRALFPFWNVMIQGWRAEGRMMSHPTTRGGWWFKYATTNGIARILTALAATGVLGQALKELYAAISGYDQANYITVPVGSTEGGEFGSRTAYLRIPESETDRLLGGLISNGIKAVAGDDTKLSEIFDFGMGQFPTLNPIVTVPAAWAQFASGHNPRDPFTGRDIVPSREWAAGGMDSFVPMAGWTLNQSGVGNWLRWDPRSETTWEAVLSATPGINRVAKVSDQGLREQQRAGMDEEAAQRARAKLKLPGSVQALEMEYFRLNRIPKERQSPAQAERLVELRGWYRTVYSPAWQTLEEEQKAGRDTASLRRRLEEDSKPWAR
jgi:hypothetical protein